MKRRIAIGFTYATHSRAMSKLNYIIYKINTLRAPDVVRCYNIPAIRTPATDVEVDGIEMILSPTGTLADK